MGRPKGKTPPKHEDRHQRTNDLPALITQMRKLTVMDILEHKHVSPIEQMCDMLNEPELSHAMRFRILEALASYVYAKERKIEVSGEIGHKLIEAVRPQAFIASPRTLALRSSVDAPFTERDHTSEGG
jgi:hypothetical protein